MLSFAPDYDHLPLIAKVEVFELGLQSAEGNDLAKVLVFLQSSLDILYYMT
jgi:FKBP12-rapamycin complex-associated protein